MRVGMIRRKAPSAIRTYRADIEGLRGLAVLAVIASDCKVPWLRGGFVGIDVLFVVYGYLICSTVYRELKEGRFDILRFYERRLKRAVPGLSLILLFCMGFAIVALSPWESYRLGQAVVATSLLASNFLFIVRTNYFAERALSEPLLMTWCVALGAQFCLAFPLLMLVLKNKTKRSLLVYLAVFSSLSLLLSVYAEYRYPIWNFYLPVTRAWEFGAGCLLAVWQAGRQASAKGASWRVDGASTVGALMIAAAIILYHPGTSYPGIETILPVLGTALVLGSPNALPNYLLSIRPFVFMGAISYPLYLWHWPLLSFAEILSSKPLRPETVSILMAGALIAAIVSFLLLEWRFVAVSTLKPGRACLTYGAWLFLVLIMGGAFYETKGLPWRTPDLYGIESRAALYRHYPCISSGSYLRISEHCAPPLVASEPAIAVLGGGHAEAFAEGLRAFTSRHKWQLVTLTRESCPPLKGVSEWSSRDATLANSCRSFNQSALAYVISRPDIQVVVLVGRWAGDYVSDADHGAPQNSEQNALSLKLGLQNEVAALETAGKRVIVIGDVPQFSFNPVEGVRNQLMPFRRQLNRALLSEQPEQGDGTSEARSLSITPEAEQAAKQIAALKTTDPRLTVVDPNEVLCDANRCYFAAGSDLYYFDAIHLSSIGAERILPLLPDLKAILRSQ